MTVEIRVQSVKPLRQTFGHIARRFGDKPATRYQEGTYDLQSTVNHHYKPLWDPEHDIYDRRRTAIVMADWYALKDPRQYYYGSWTIARSKQQEAADRQMEFAEKRDLLRQLPADLQAALQRAILPLRHYEWGANTNLCFVSAYGYGTALTQAASMATMDRLGMAQHVSRIGLLLDGNSGASLAEAKRLWLDDPAWQGLRRQMEAIFVGRDPIETFVAQALVADALVYDLCYRRFEPLWTASQGAGVATLLDFPLRWQEETNRWVDAVVKTMAAESEANRQTLQGWVDGARARWTAALAPLAAAVLGDAAGAAALAEADAALGTRLTKLGLKASASNLNPGAAA
jgi:phenol hydroxylase P1 protein